MIECRRIVYNCEHYLTDTDYYAGDRISTVSYVNKKKQLID